MKKYSYRIIFSFLLAISAFGFSSCYSWYESKVDMDSETPKITLGDFLYKEPEITSLTIPTQLIVSKGVYSGTIKLHWDEVPYATSYRIERAVVEPDLDGTTYSLPDEGDFEIINKYVYTNNYSDIILASPSDSNKEYKNRYFYRISAENIKMGLESSEFTEVSTENSGWLLNPPSVIEAAKGENQEYIEVRWSSVPMAYKYQIYRSEKSNGLGMELLDTVTGNITSYKNILTTPEKGVEFYYKVCAILDNGSTSAFTGLAMGYSAKEGAPSAPSNLKVVNAKAKSVNSLQLSWDSVSGTGTITYSLYRTSSEDSVYTLVCSNLTGTSYEDKSLLKTGIKYYYYVQAVDTKEDEKLKSPFSKTGPGTPSEAVGWLLSPPSNCEIEDTSEVSSILFRWTPSVGFESVEYLYNIYSSDSISGEYTLISSAEKIPAGSLILGTDGYYSIVLPKHSFYKISAINKLNEVMESVQSYAVAPCPAAPSNVVATKTSALDGLEKYAPNTNGVYPVMITWNAPANESPAGYHVYRSTKPDSAFRKITDSPLSENSFSFIDSNETARPGTFYYYKVVSLNILQQGKNANVQNENSRGYGAITRDQWFREYNKTVKKSQTKLTLMHKGSTDALGSESAKGDISGTLAYNARLDGLGARITMHYDNYAEFYISNNSDLGVYFLLTGDTNTSANMSANGSMDGTMRAAVSGMYPGYAKYEKLEIKGGGAGGGYYIVCTQDKNGQSVLGEGNVDWTVGEE